MRLIAVQFVLQQDTLDRSPNPVRGWSEQNMNPIDYYCYISIVRVSKQNIGLIQQMPFVWAKV